jgi:hypothetical protein
MSIGKTLMGLIMKTDCFGKILKSLFQLMKPKVYVSDHCVVLFKVRDSFAEILGKSVIIINIKFKVLKSSWRWQNSITFNGPLRLHAVSCGFFSSNTKMTTI